MKGLKITLWICAVLGLLGFIFAALPWPAVETVCRWVGVQAPVAQPITVFAYRLGCVVCGGIGVFFVILAQDPLKYGAMLLLAAYGLMIYGVLAFVGGIRYGLPLQAFLGDAVFGVVFGILVLIFRQRISVSDT